MWQPAKEHTKDGSEPCETSASNLTTMPRLRSGLYFSSGCGHVFFGRGVGSFDVNEVQCQCIGSALTGQQPVTEDKVLSGRMARMRGSSPELTSAPSPIWRRFLCCIPVQSTRGAAPC
jgi:hypothetical protein